MAKLTLSFKGRAIKSYQFEEGTVLIGRDNDNTVQVDSLAIAPRHASVNFDLGEPLLKQTDKAFPVRVNGETKEEHSLQHGDKIEIGKHTLFYSEQEQSLFSPPPLSPSQAPTAEQPEFDDSNLDDEKQPSSAYLQIMSGANIGRLKTLKKGLTRIGKKGSSIAVVVHRKDGYFLSQLEGDTPLKINNEVLEKGSAQLSESDVIELDRVKMQFFLDD